MSEAAVPAALGFVPLLVVEGMAGSSGPKNKRQKEKNRTKQGKRSHRVTLWSHVPAWPQAISMNTSPLWQPSSLAMLSLCWRSKRKSTRQPQPLSWASLGWNHTRQHLVILEILVSPQVWKPLNDKPLLQCNAFTRRANRMFWWTFFSRFCKSWLSVEIIQGWNILNISEWSRRSKHSHHPSSFQILFESNRCYSFQIRVHSLNCL